MFVFGKNLIFVDEPLLQRVNIEPKGAIKVISCSEIPLSKIFSLQSPWVEMSGRRVRYYAHVPFEKQKYVERWAFEVEDVVTLLWDAKSSSISYQKGRWYNAGLLAFWVLHTFFPMVLQLAKQYDILHTSGVELGHGVVLFSAHSGGGKSTLIDYFIQQEHTIYGDDIVALKSLKNGYDVIPSYPYHRPFREVETLGFEVAHFAQNPKRLQAFYSLERVSQDAPVEIRELKGAEKFEALYESLFVAFEHLRESHFHFVTQMAKCVPVYRLAVPWKKSRLDEVYQAILTHNHV